MSLEEQINALGRWYHRIELAPGVFTPAPRNQSLVYDLYTDRLGDVAGARVLDLGANACGLSVEFAKRGAEVVAVEHSPKWAHQGQFVIKTLGLQDRIDLREADLFDVISYGAFDIVCYVGLSYHVRYPQLALDMLSNLCKGHLLTSTQIKPGGALDMRNRADRQAGADQKMGELYGWEPTVRTYLNMIALAGFADPATVSLAPHKGADSQNSLSNAAYFYARGARVTPLPFRESINARVALESKRRAGRNRAGAAR